MGWERRDEKREGRREQGRGNPGIEEGKGGERREGSGKGGGKGGKGKRREGLVHPPHNLSARRSCLKIVRVECSLLQLSVRSRSQRTVHTAYVATAPQRQAW